MLPGGVQERGVTAAEHKQCLRVPRSPELLAMINQHVGAAALNLHLTASFVMTGSGARIPLAHHLLTQNCPKSSQMLYFQCSVHRFASEHASIARLETTNLLSRQQVTDHEKHNPSRYGREQTCGQGAPPIAASAPPL